jgi:hypothetical protein
MKELKLSGWEDFERAIGDVLRQYSNKCQEVRSLRFSPPLFRGQSNACWPLKTTLERYTDQPFTMKGYWELIRNVKSHVESVTEKRWDIGDYPEPEVNHPEPPPGYPFMIYLRHHGFPSPLLDWSRSPYVAAFFAFRSASGLDSPLEPMSEVALYCFHEYWEGSKIWGSNEPHIIGLGPTITTTPRHFRQQSWYTICRVRQNARYSYANHEDVFQRGDPDQDVLTRFRIPMIQWHEFLERLFLMNINAYTLFGTEESLMETLAYSAIVRKSL